VGETEVLRARTAMGLQLATAAIVGAGLVGAPLLLADRSTGQERDRAERRVAELRETLSEVEEVSTRLDLCRESIGELETALTEHGDASGLYEDAIRAALDGRPAAFAEVLDEAVDLTRSAERRYEDSWPEIDACLDEVP
jgi:hypothetical protein